MRVVRGLLVVVFGGVGWLACGDDYSDESKTGARFNPCYANGTCNVGLSCTDGLCVLSDSGGEGGANDAGLGGDAITAADGAPNAGPGALALARATCEREKRCLPVRYAAIYGASDLECQRRYLAQPQYAGGTLTEDEAEACAEVLTTSAECGTHLLLQPPCTPAGTLAIAAACNFGYQCKSAVCHVNPLTDCGICVTGKPKDSACDPTDECAAGLYCEAAKCQRLGKLGDDCGVLACESGLTCDADAKKCKLPGGVGDACEIASEATDCAIGLRCGPEKKCIEAAWRKNGETCDLGQKIFCAQGRCSGGTCAPYQATGGSCDPSASCDPSVDTCKEGKCVSLSAAVCN